MDYVNNYNEYISSSNNDLIKKISKINERFGTPNILKNLFKDLWVGINNMINNNISEKFFKLNEEYINIDKKIYKFEKNLKISISYKNRSDIYSKSSHNSIYLEFDKNSYNENELRKIIFHELLHIYEIFFRMKENKSSKNWSINIILNNIRDKYESDNFLSIFIYFIYLSFDHEINARICETYMVLMDLFSNDENYLLNELENTSAWKYKNMLNNFELKGVNYNNIFLFLKEFNSEINKKIPKIINKLFRIPKDIKESEKILKEWKILFKNKSIYFEKKLIKVVDDVIFDINMINNSKIDEFNNFEITFPVELLRESRIRKILREK